MKILVISASFPPMRTGEAANAFYLCHHLSLRGFDVHVLTTKTDALATRISFTLHPIMLNWSWDEAPRFVRFLKACRPDAILLVYIDFIYNNHPMITFAPSFCGSVLPSVPFITRFENPIGIPPSRYSFLTRLLRRVVAWQVGATDITYRFGSLLRDSHRVIVLSNRHRDALSTIYPPVNSKTILIPPAPNMLVCPSNNGATREEGRHLLRAQDKEFFLVYFGYMYPGKGLETLLRAVKIVKGQRENVRLVLMGGSIDSKYGPGRSYVEDMRRLSEELGIGDNITWIGDYRTDNREASLYLHAADVCVLPFDTGVQLNNSSFAAAAAHGLPIVTTQGAFLEEPFIHGENVFLCPPKDPDLLAAAVETLIEEPEVRRRLGRGAEKLSQEWFSWESAIERTITTFN